MGQVLLTGAIPGSSHEDVNVMKTNSAMAAAGSPGRDIQMNQMDVSVEYATFPTQTYTGYRLQCQLNMAAASGPRLQQEIQYEPHQELQTSS